ncbi:MAG: folate-binding protein YgfZ [Ideonella sp.]|nr:folate-binding protein YgfZ [Ideonella sp.]
MSPNDPSVPVFDGAVRLADLGVIRASGTDAASFLHGQLTNDITHLGPDEARLAGYCSAKGRLLASFIVWRKGDELLLACSADLLAPTLKRLRMFVLRAKCTLADASAELPLYGLAGAAALAWLGAAAPAAAGRKVDRDGGATVIRLPDAAGQPRFLCAGLDAPPPLPALEPQSWRWLEVRSGVARIELATVEQFVPQMLNYELVGGVDFGKGCYPGQEIVARSQYRGTIKRRSLLFETATGAAPAGSEIFHSDDPAQPAGQVVSGAADPGGGGSLALAEVKLAALASGSLHLGAPDGALLRRVAMPYELPLEAAAAT